MTEDEARTRWCPFARTVLGRYIANPGVQHGNRWPQDTSNVPLGTNCLASSCMAWRWYESHEFTQRDNAEFKRSGRRLQPEDGFCGLAVRG